MKNPDKKARLLRRLLWLGAILPLALPCAVPAMAATPEAGPRTSWQQTPPPLDEENPQAALNQAKKRFQQAEEDFTRAEDAEAKAALGAKQAGKTQPNPTKTAAPQPEARTQSTREPAIQPWQGSPETGYSGTWNDPANGDIITSVIAPTPPPSYSQTQNYPMIIEPQVSASDWGSSGNSWNSGWQSGWPQWPGYPGDPGYPIEPPHQYPGPMPPPPVWNRPPNFGPIDQPPPFPPGYRPLRPWPPNGGWNGPGNNGPNPLPPQGIPGTPGFNPNPPTGGPSNPLPPQGIPGTPGFNPNPPPGGPSNPLPPSGIPGYPGFNPNPPMSGQPGYSPGQPFPGPVGPPPFPVGPGNPGLQPGPGPLPNGPGPGFRPMPPQGTQWGARPLSYARPHPGGFHAWRMRPHARGVRGGR